MRPKICDMIDTAWNKLSIIDFHTHQLVKKALCDKYGVPLVEGEGGKGGGRDSAQLSFTLFEKLIMHPNSVFQPYLQTGSYVRM